MARKVTSEIRWEFNFSPLLKAAKSLKAGSDKLDAAARSVGRRVQGSVANATQAAKTAAATLKERAANQRAAKSQTVLATASKRLDAVKRALGRTTERLSKSTNKLRMSTDRAAKAAGGAGGFWGTYRNRLHGVVFAHARLLPGINAFIPLMGRLIPLVIGLGIAWHSVQGGVMAADAALKALAESGELANIEAAFDALAGKDARDFESNLLSVARGMLRTKELQQVAVGAITAGLAQSSVVKAVEGLTRIAISRGLDVQKAVRSGLEGIQRGEARNLLKFGVDRGAITRGAPIQLRQQQLVEQLGKITAILPDFTDTLEISQARIRTALSDFRDDTLRSIGQNRSLRVIASDFAKWLERVTKQEALMARIREFDLIPILIKTLTVMTQWAQVAVALAMVFQNFRVILVPLLAVIGDVSAGLQKLALFLGTVILGTAAVFGKLLSGDVQGAKAEARFTSGELDAILARRFGDGIDHLPTVIAKETARAEAAAAQLESVLNFLIGFEQSIPGIEQSLREKVEDFTEIGSGQDAREFLENTEAAIDALKKQLQIEADLEKQRRDGFRLIPAKIASLMRELDLRKALVDLEVKLTAEDRKRKKTILEMQFEKEILNLRIRAARAEIQLQRGRLDIAAEGASPAEQRNQAFRRFSLDVRESLLKLRGGGSTFFEFLGDVILGLEQLPRTLSKIEESGAIAELKRTIESLRVDQQGTKDRAEQRAIGREIMQLEIDILNIQREQAEVRGEDTTALRHQIEMAERLLDIYDGQTAELMTQEQVNLRQARREGSLIGARGPLGDASRARSAVQSAQENLDLLLQTGGSNLEIQQARNTLKQAQFDLMQLTLGANQRFFQSWEEAIRGQYESMTESLLEGDLGAVAGKFFDALKQQVVTALSAAIFGGIPAAGGGFQPSLFGGDLASNILGVFGQGAGSSNFGFGGLLQGLGGNFLGGLFGSGAVGSAASTGAGAAAGVSGGSGGLAALGPILAGGFLAAGLISKFANKKGLRLDPDQIIKTELVKVPQFLEAPLRLLPRSRLMRGFAAFTPPPRSPQRAGAGGMHFHFGTVVGTDPVKLGRELARPVSQHLQKESFRHLRKRA